MARKLNKLLFQETPEYTECAAAEYKCCLTCWYRGSDWEGETYVCNCTESPYAYKCVRGTHTCTEHSPSKHSTSCMQRLSFNEESVEDNIRIFEWVFAERLF